MDVMVQLGGYQFAIETAAYQSLSRSTAYRWQPQDRIGQRAAVQFTGPGAETITLSGVIYPHWRGGIGQIDAMRAEAAKGKPLMLVDGLGRVHGRWVIERVDESQEAFSQSGAPLKQRFTMKIRKADDGV